MAYYSTLKTGVYHVCKNCHVGNNIEGRNLRTGQPPEASLCELCKDLRNAGRCEPGIPIPAR